MYKRSGPIHPNWIAGGLGYPIVTKFGKFFKSLANNFSIYFVFHKILDQP